MIKEGYYGYLKNIQFSQCLQNVDIFLHLKKSQNDQLRFKDTYFRHSLHCASLKIIHHLPAAFQKYFQRKATDS